jgi:5-methylcytosine-specific restriction protein A
LPRAPKVCSSPGCPNSQPCPVHRKVSWQGSTRRSRLPKDWPSKRQQVINEEPVCRICSNALTVEVDHIVNNDDHSRRNLQGLCVRCHRHKTAREGQAAR